MEGGLEMKRDYSFLRSYVVNDDLSLSDDFFASAMGISNMDCYYALQYKFDDLESKPDYDATKNYSLGARE
jgi:hypothetical protein